MLVSSGGIKLERRYIDKWKKYIHPFNTRTKLCINQTPYNVEFMTVDICIFVQNKLLGYHNSINVIICKLTFKGHYL